MKLKVFDKEFLINHNKEFNYYWCEIPTTSTPISIVSKDGNEFLISMLSGGESGAEGLYHLRCTKVELQDMLNCFLTQIKIAANIEVI